MHLDSKRNIPSACVTHRRPFFNFAFVSLTENFFFISVLQVKLSVKLVVLNLLHSWLPSHTKLFFFSFNGNGGQP